jgi:hypothetical protein
MSKYLESAKASFSSIQYYKQLDSCIFMIREASRTPNYVCVNLSPNYVASELAYKFMKNILSYRADIDFIDNVLEIRLPNGSVIKFLNSEDSEKFVWES